MRPRRSMALLALSLGRALSNGCGTLSLHRISLPLRGPLAILRGSLSDALALSFAAHGPPLVIAGRLPRRVASRSAFVLMGRTSASLPRPARARAAARVCSASAAPKTPRALSRVAAASLAPAVAGKAEP